MTGIDKKEKLIILGKSGSGKNFLSEKLIEKGLNSTPKITTRPMRVGEIDGRDYIFVSDETFKDLLDNNKLLTYQFFTVTPQNSEPVVWYYGITKESFEKSQIFIMTPGEYSHINWNEYKKSDFFVVYLDIDRDIREKRLMARDDRNDSIKRRLDADDIDFSNFYDYDLKVTDPEFTYEDIWDLMD